MHAFWSVGCGLLAVALVVPGAAFGQGALAPPGAPAPTMVTLQQVHDAVSAASTNLVVLQDTLMDVDFGALGDNLGMMLGITNIVPVLEHLDYAIASLTNALYGMDWRDVLKIRSDVELLTNQLSGLAGLDALAMQLGALSNSLLQIVAVTNFAGATLQQTGVIIQELAAQQAELDAILDLEQANSVLLQMITNNLP